MSPRSVSLLFLFVYIPASLSEAATTTRPRALVAQVSRDSATLQYVTQIEQKTPLENERL
ncbi:hypothetical protein KI387_010948, partial [Taxus chinensis]